MLKFDWPLIYHGNIRAQAKRINNEILRKNFYLPLNTRLEKNQGIS